MTNNQLLDELKDRELEIIQLMADGASNQQIADRLSLSTNTVRWYNKQIYSKFGVNSRIKVINLAREWGLLDAEDSASYYPHPQEELVVSANIPRILTSFVGRSHDIRELKKLILASQILTITGPPGVGKTRLVLEVAQTILAENYFERVYFVSLASLSEASLVPQAILQNFGLHATAQMSVLDTIKSFIQGKKLLLILDNFEHVLSAHTFIDQLIKDAPNLHILITSREALEIAHEQIYVLEPLSIPETTGNLEQLTENNAIQLFIDRAHSQKPRWEVRADEYHDIAQICHYLEGIPLALELAAARINILSPRHMLQQFTNRLDFVDAGLHDLPQRHRTLRHAIAWSYALLSEDEQIIFARLGLFQGGCSLAGIQHICFFDNNLDMVEIVASLIRKSLLTVYEDANAEPRFQMLETIREYALEQLPTHDDLSRVKENYKSYYVQLAQNAYERRTTVEVGHWVSVCEIELDNIRQILQYCLDTQQPDNGVTILNSIYWALGIRGYSHEGINWYNKFLVNEVKLPVEIVIKAHHSLGELLRWYGEIQKAYLTQTKGFALAEAYEDKSLIGLSLGYIALTSIYSEIKDEYELDYLAKIQQSIQSFEDANDIQNLGWALNVQGVLHKMEGQIENAKRSLEKGLEIAEELQNPVRITTVLKNLADIAKAERDYAYAANLLNHSLEKNLTVGDIHLTVGILISIANLVAEIGHYRDTATLLGAIERINKDNYFTVSAPNRPQYDMCLKIIQENLDESEASQYWDAGYRLSLDEAVLFGQKLMQDLLNETNT